MNIERKTEVFVRTTDGLIMNEGKTYVFTTSSSCLVGIYNGISKQGALKFFDVFNGNTEFNVMPKSVVKIHEIRSLNIEYAQES